MRAYIGVKIIHAEPGPAPRQIGTHAAGAPGYIVRYPDGYESWSPADVFEAAYRPISAAEQELVAKAETTDGT